MKIIGAGFGRSGTMSLQQALEILGYGPCYHMKIALKRPHHLHFFLKAWHGQKVDWRRFFRKYNAVVDWPTCSFYRELMEVYPEARILLNVRDPEKWYDSMNETIWAIQPAFPSVSPVVRRIHDEIIWSGNLKGDFSDRQRTVAAYREHVDEVVRTVPADRLLVYNVKEGWGPLCRFLDVPVPDRQFPRKNDRRSFLRMIRLLKVLNWLVPAVVITVIIMLALLLWP